MDPNETLRLGREAIAKHRRCNEALDPQGCQDALFDMWAAFEDLDEWLTKGGFLPKEWDHEDRHS